MSFKVDPTNNTLGAPRASQAPSATDFRQFAELRRSAGENDPKALRAAAQQFESLFTKMMLESMRQAGFGDSLFGSDQGDMYQSMMDDQLAVSLSQGKGLGLADMLIRQLSHGTTPTPKVDDAQKQKFIDEVLPHATAAARELGVDPRALVAQAALETGWGTSQPSDAGGNSHNYFGIKAGASWRGDSVENSTTEFSNGVAGRENARFRAYDGVAESVADYVRVLSQPRYAAALNTGGDVRAFATALQRGGYATDPEYANKIVAVAERLGLAARVTSFKSPDVEPIPGTEKMRTNDA